MLPPRPFGMLLFAIAMSVAAMQPAAAQASGPPERKVVEKVEPVYPLLAKRTNVRGIVKLEVAIRANGSVKSVKVLGGNPVLLDSATQAVRNWKFEAAPEETTEVVRVSFEPR